MADSPQINAEGVVRIVVTSEGTAIADTLELISATVRRAVNTVPSARLVFIDGDMPNETFPASDGATFAPGAAIKISAGYGDTETAIFEGIVVKHGISISGQNDARLTVECRDKAVKMTVGRKNAQFVDQADSDIISALIGDYGLTADVTATDETHPELVQHYCTDWDFMLARAEANGLLVVVTDGTVAVKAPDTSSAAVLTVTYGTDLIDFDATLDSRSQYTAVQASSWDMKTQAALDGSSAAPRRLNAQGNLSSSTLAQVMSPDSLRLQTAAAVTTATLTQWAKAQQLKSGLARLRGSVRFQGSARATVGGILELAGVGERFNGKAFIGGVNHEITGGDWITAVDFGMAPDWFTERPDIAAPPAAGLVPGIEGLQIGVVKKLDADPGGEQRVCVTLPVLGLESTGVWARLLKFYGSSGFGAFFIPEVGDEVVLGYFSNDPSYPVILGSVYSSKHAPPYALTAENNTKAIVTRCKAKIEFNDEDKIITISTPGKNTVVISDKDKSITLTDQNSNKVELGTGGITLDSPKDIKITAKGTITLDAVGALTITSKADVKCSGLNINCEAQVGAVVKGSASAELSAAGQTTVKGAMVMIN